MESELATTFMLGLRINENTMRVYAEKQSQSEAKAKPVPFTM